MDTVAIFCAIDDFCTPISTKGNQSTFLAPRATHGYWKTGEGLQNVDRFPSKWVGSQGV